jgi:hypothetical protein
MPCPIGLAADGDGIMTESSARSLDQPSIFRLSRPNNLSQPLPCQSAYNATATTPWTQVYLDLDLYTRTRPDADTDLATPEFADIPPPAEA